MAADAAGAAVDQDTHPLLHLRDLDERDPGGQARDAEARRLRGIDPDWYRRDRRLQEQGVLGMRPIAARIGNAGDELAVELARTIAAERARESERKDLLEQAAAHLPVDRIHARRAHFD